MAIQGLTISFPLKDDDKGFFLSTDKVTTKAISSQIFFLLTTRKGERFYYPDYGTDLLKFLFEPNDSILEFDIQQDIKNAISKFIPNVEIDKIHFIKEEENSNLVIVDIAFTYSDSTFSESDRLTISFSLPN